MRVGLEPYIFSSRCQSFEPDCLGSIGSIRGFLLSSRVIRWEFGQEKEDMMEALTVKDCQSLADEIGLQVLLLTLDEVDNGHVEQMSFFFFKN